MSQFVQGFDQDAIVGEPEVVEDHRTVREVADHPAWLRLKDAVVSFRALQTADGSVPDPSDHAAASGQLATILQAVAELAPFFPHDASYLVALQRDFERWGAEGFGVPDFLDSLNAFQPQQHRVDGLGHLVVFPMVTQNGSSSRFVEALLVEVIWPEFIAALEAGDHDNDLFVALRFVDFTPGYDTNSAVLFPETVAMREIPTFTWGAIFQDREAARYRRVVRAAAEITKLELPDEAAAMLDDQQLTEQVFVMWDIIHDRSHMRGDLPFDPFMIKQRMPFFLYSLEELRCDLTAYRESVRLDRSLTERPDDELSDEERAIRDHARLVQYAVVFDRIFRFAITGSRVRNYDGLGGQLLFAWMHQHGVLHWTDTQLTIDWPEVPDVVIALSDEINELYWRSIDRPKAAHWLAAHRMLARTLTPHPASVWARGLPDETLAGLPRGYTDAVLDDEFPLSMFYEALNKKMAAVIASTAGITGSSSVARSAAPPVAPSVDPSAAPPVSGVAA
ncbi:DUF6421 family protein [Curtobacterium sp. MCPF17_002]|uniref:DUF6421 family protein n=1 Tax=Curtobacterium sp. MCPF17_002 TaxID=2175645 RepID=UPI001C647E4B|nr:DUF6421 family protein [Curtobacterium sp. MCPF17_002]WIB76980.1 DUF6421 family protein [Curtobacterium sp. MCPF17_002]